MTAREPSCLVLKNDGLGDLILCSGILEELAEHFEGRLDLVTCHGNREIAESIRGLRHIFYVSRNGLQFLPGIDRLRCFVPISRQPQDLKLLWRLRQRRYDVAIALRRFIRVSTLVLMRWSQAADQHCAWQFPSNLSAARARHAGEGWQHWPGGAEPLSEIDYYRRFLQQSLGLEISGRPRLDLSLLPKIDGPKSNDNGRDIGLCIGGASMAWPTAHWIELVGRLVEDGWSPHLFGGPDARQMALALTDAHPACRSHVAELGFMASLPLLRDCRAFIGHDTGFTHFAALVVPRCLMLLGGGTFERFYPWPQGHNQWAIYHGLDCFDCDWRCKFAERHCLSRLKPEDVLTTFRNMLTSKTPGPHRINTNGEPVTYDVAWRYPACDHGRRAIAAAEPR